MLQILSEHNVKIDYDAVATKLGRSVSAIKQHLAKMKNDAKKVSSNFTGSDDTGSVGAPATPTPKAVKRRAPKQKVALATPTSDLENEDIAAGYGSNGETRAEETPTKAAVKKPRAPRKAKVDADGEPATKKQKTTKAAKSTKATSPAALTEQLVAVASPIKKDSVKMEAGSEDETEVESKPKLEKMEEDGDAEHDGAGDQGCHLEGAMNASD